MGWSIGYDDNWKRDIGYGVPATCDHPGCGAQIDRGLGFVCGGDSYGGERGCGLFFCNEHMLMPISPKLPPQLCDRCYPRKREPFEPTPDVPRWIRHKLKDESWSQWRAENPDEVAACQSQLAASDLAREKARA